MSKSPDPPDTALASAAREYAELKQQIDSMRTVLTRLFQDVVHAESLLGGTQAVKLRETNEQLVVAALRDQTDAQAAAQALNEASIFPAHDTLTQLPNRALFLDRFEMAMANARRHGTRLGLLLVGIDNFKEINGTVGDVRDVGGDAVGNAGGEAVSDQVLQAVARCITTSVRTVDTVNRHGGDEFLVLLAEISEVSNARVVAEKLCGLLGTSCRINDHAFRVTTSIGIALYPDGGEDATVLIERAHDAMLQARMHGLGTSVFEDDVSGIRPGVVAVLAGHPVDSQTQAGDSPTTAATPVPRPNLQPRQAQLQDVNTQLVLAALSAQELQAAAERAQRRQAEFLAVVAHELRNPLAPIRIAATLLGRVRTDGPLLPRAQAIIERQVEHMSHLINDLLDMARANIGKFKVDHQPVELSGVIATAVETCRPGIDARQQNFTVEMPSAVLKVLGDSHRLVQIFSNLLDNASKYTPQGGAIGLSVVASDGTVVITVSDNGIGISAEILPVVFDPFVQDSHAIGFNGIGAGLGLAVVKELVEAHQGWVVATSGGQGLGSQFAVTLALLA